MSEVEPICLTTAYDAVGKEVEAIIDNPDFVEVGSALFCTKVGCTKVCDITSFQKDNRMYGDCKEYTDAQIRKKGKKESKKRRVTNKTSALALRAVAAISLSDDEQPIMTDPDTAQLLQSLTEPRIPKDRIDAAALEASSRYHAMQLNHIDPEERLGDDLLGSLGSRAVDRTLFRR